MALSLQQPAYWAGRIYKWACVVVVSGFLALIALVLVLAQFDAKQLPNGTWLRRQHVLAGERDIVLWDGAGRRLVEDPIDLMCYDDASVYGWTMTGYTFLHRCGWSEAMLSGDPGFEEAYERSGLRTGSDSCGTSRRPMLGPLLIMYPYRHRPPPELYPRETQRTWSSQRSFAPSGPPVDRRG